MSFRTSFLAWAERRFPELHASFIGETREMRVWLAFQCFLEHTQDAIDNNRCDEVAGYFQMADRVLKNAYPKMRSLFRAWLILHAILHRRLTRRHTFELFALSIPLAALAFTLVYLATTLGVAG